MHVLKLESCNRWSRMDIQIDAIYIYIYIYIYGAGQSSINDRYLDGLVSGCRRDEGYL